MRDYICVVSLAWALCGGCEPDVCSCAHCKLYECTVSFVLGSHRCCKFFEHMVNLIWGSDRCDEVFEHMVNPLWGLHGHCELVEHIDGLVWGLCEYYEVSECLVSLTWACVDAESSLRVWQALYGAYNCVCLLCRACKCPIRFLVGW